MSVNDDTKSSSGFTRNHLVVGIEGGGIGSTDSLT